MQRTLLLNSTYEPMTVIDWRRAIVLVYLEKTDVLANYEQVVQSPSCRMHIPSVLRLRDRVRRNVPVVRFSRPNIYARDRHTCQYCHKIYAVRDLTYDHVVPKSRGGRTEWTNIVTCCIRCNRRKGNRLPDEIGMYLKRRPIRPRRLVDHADLVGGNPPADWKFYLCG